MKLFESDKDAETTGVFWKAASFYSRALRAFTDDAEVAFLHLISALEIIALCLEFTEEELYDKQALSDLRAIEEHVPKGDAVARRIRARLFQIERRVTETTVRLTNSAFFSGHELPSPEHALTEERLRGAVQAAYDVRSRYVHSGLRFSVWADPHAAVLNEVVLGTPFLDPPDYELANLLSEMPTFLGLERLTRFVILRFAHSNTMPLADALA